MTIFSWPTSVIVLVCHIMWSHVVLVQNVDRTDWDEDPNAEEEVISLQPVGAGFQCVEPDSANTNSLRRPTTPAFPLGQSSHSWVTVFPLASLYSYKVDMFLDK